MLLFSLPGLGTLHLFDALLQEPAQEAPAVMLLGNGGIGHYIPAPVGEVLLVWVGRDPFMMSPGSIRYRRTRGQGPLRPPGPLFFSSGRVLRRRAQRPRTGSWLP